MNETENQPVETPAEPFPTFAALRARHSELLDADGDESYLADVQDFFNRVRATGAVLSVGEERRATQSILNYWATVLYRADRKPSNTTLVELDPEYKPKLDDARSPYPGVREFDETEGKFFFGRQRTIDYLLARLKEESFLALVGPSGVGKSSFVRAGLLPAIKKIGLEEDHDEVQRHYFPIITPGRDPLTNLASLLAGAIKLPESPTTEQYREKLKYQSQYLADFLAETIGKPAVIVVDQFEELFTLCENADAQRRFIDNLLALGGTAHRVILCANIEDLGVLLKRLPQFQKVFERGRTLLPRLGVGELTDAITKPADLVGFKFKDKTIKDIVQEIGTLPIALPLLQFTLVKLWEKRGEHDQYFAEIGGCRQLLTKSAEEFLSSLKVPERELAEQIFRKMVKFEYKYWARFPPVQLEAHSAAVRVRDLRSELGTPTEVDAMVDRMGKSQLIRRSFSATPEETQLELVHDSLVQNWPRLAQWVEWQKDRRFRIKSTMAAALLILIVVALAVGGKEITKSVGRYRSHEQALRLARASRKAWHEKRPDTAMLLSVGGYLAETAGEFGVIERAFFPDESDLQTRGALLSSMLFQPIPKKFLKYEDIGDIAFSPKNLLFAANDNNGNIVIWNLANEQRICDQGIIKDQIAKGGDISPLIFTNDGQQVISGGAEEHDDQVQGAVSLWNVAGCRQDRVFRARDIGRVSAVSLSRNGKRLAALGNTGVVIWEIASGAELLKLIYAPNEIHSIALSSSGTILALGHAEGDIVLWDVQRRASKPLGACQCVKQEQTSNVIASIAFSPNDQELAVSGSEETMLWSLSTKDQPVRLAASREGVGMILAFSADGKRLAGFEGSDQVYLWDLTKDPPERVGKNLFQSITPASSLAFSSDVSTLATLSEQGITLWDLSGQQSLVGQTDNISSIAFRPDSKVFAAGDESGFIVLRDATSGTAIGAPLVNEQQSSIVSLAFSQSGWLASGLYRAGITLWNAEGREVSSVGPEVLDQRRSAQKDLETSLEVWAIAFRGHNKSLVSIAKREGSGELQLDEWSVPEMNRMHGPYPIPLDRSKPTAVGFNVDTSMLAVAFDSQKIQMWDIGDLRTPPKMTKELSDLGTTIQTLEFSPDRNWLVFGGKNSDSVFRYDLREHQTKRILSKLRGKQNQKNPAPIFLEGLSGDIVDLSFPSDSRMLAVAVTLTRGIGSQEGYQPGAVVLVDIAESRVITEPIRGPDSELTTVSFRPDSLFLSIGSKHGSVLLWNLDPSEAKQRLCAVVNRPFTTEEEQEYSILNLNPCGIK